MESRNMQAELDGDPDKKGKSGQPKPKLPRDMSIPDWLKPMVEGLDAWDWNKAEIMAAVPSNRGENPDYPKGVSFNKRDYKWIRLYNCDLLKILFGIDGEGRIATTWASELPTVDTFEREN